MATALATYQISTAREISHQNRSRAGSAVAASLAFCFVVCPLPVAPFAASFDPLQRSQEPGRAKPAVAYEHRARPHFAAAGDAPSDCALRMKFSFTSLSPIALVSES